jgi:hypothetical protein
MPGFLKPENSYPANALFPMPHIHPAGYLPEQAASLKGCTAREENFWVVQGGSFGKRNLTIYIESNPVKARFVDSADKYRWSSAAMSVEMSLDAADTSVRATAGLVIFRPWLPK